MSSVSRIVLGFLITVFLPTIAVGDEVYQYTNAAGRTVYSKTPPEGVNADKKKQEKSNDNGIITDEDHGIYSECQAKWGMDFKMKEHCINLKKDARRNLQKYDQKIVSFCKNKWHDDYEMMEYCAREQSSARRRLGE